MTAMDDNTMASASSSNKGGSSDQLEPIYLLYDERMLKHKPVDWKEPFTFPVYRDEVDEDYPIENPERLRVIYNRLCNLGKRLLHADAADNDYNTTFGSSYDHPSSTSSLWPPTCHPRDRVVYKYLSCEMASKEEVCLAHSEEFYERLDQLEYYTDAELATMSDERSTDVYYCQETFKAARLAAGGLLACIDAICPSDASSPNPTSKDDPRPTNKAMALVRPPGHHACQEQEMGFCFIDSVVVAAKYALKQNKAKRIVILDWDIHDGNATAEATIRDDNIFRIDLHRYNPKTGFYPYTGPANEVGHGTAKGLNMNVTWTQGGVGNSEYGAAFYELILPLMHDYNPDLLIISCGLDAAMGDLLGDCNLTPGFFHAMTRSALEVIHPSCPVLVALEGGYTIKVIPDCMEAVTLALLNCPFSYHSSQQMEAFCSGGAADIIPAFCKRSRLDRARHILSNYYIRVESPSYMLLKSAVQDINTSIRIFSSLSRWKHIPLRRIELPPKPTNGNGTSSSNQVGGHKRSRYDSSASTGTMWYDRTWQRPRVYMWYGTEAHHQRKPGATVYRQPYLGDHYSD